MQRSHGASDCAVTPSPREEEEEESTQATHSTPTAFSPPEESLGYHEQPLPRTQMNEREVPLAQAGFLSVHWGKLLSGGVMNSANQAPLNVIIMKWMHLVSKGFFHKGNDEEVIAASADLLGTLRE